LLHLAWDGLVLPRDHPFWAIAYPPNGWGCSCYVVGARSLEDAALAGGDLSKELQPGWDKLQPNTGTPKGIGKGWDYAPGASTVELTQQIARKASKWDPRIASAFFQGLPSGEVDALAQAYRRLTSLHDKLRRYAQANIVATAAERRQPSLQPPFVTLGPLTQTQMRWLGEEAADTPLQWRVSGLDLWTQANGGDVAIDPEDWPLLVQMLDAPDLIVVPGPVGSSTIELRREVGGRVLVAVFVRDGLGLKLVAVWFEAAP
jgi:hypothetical protein